MRLLVTSVPGLAHPHPVLPLALAAARAGHDVRMSPGSERVDRVRRCGLSAQPAGLTLAALRERVAAQGLTGPELTRRLFTLRSRWGARPRPVRRRARVGELEQWWVRVSPPISGPP